MSSVFSSLVRPAKTQRSPSSTSDPLRASENSAEKTPDVDPDLRELNVALQALTDIFPDIQPEVFREMLSSFSEESRLQVITEALLKHGHKWVRGRYRMPSEQDEQREVAHKYKYRSVEAQKDTRGVPLALADTFRSQQYKDAAKEALYHEFIGLSHSTIKAVLAEYNWSYTLSRPTLLDLSSKSWRSSITNFLMRRKTPTAKDHPLVTWLPADPNIGRVRIPFLIKTKCEELNTELYSSLIVPEVDRQQKEQVQEDFDLALKCNEEAAEAAGEVYDCECCFIPNTLQQMSTCNVEGHYICFTCIRHAINAALYDQGWARNINPEFCTLKCIAPMTDGVDDCSGCIPLDFVRRALLEEKNGADTVNKLNERLSSEALLKAQLPLIRCPFCSYAEIDDLALPGTNLFANMRLRRRPLLLVSVPLLELLCYEAARVVFSFLIGLLSVALIINCLLPAPLPVLAPVHSALRRIHLKRRGLRFQCHSPTCGRNSCLSCLAPWHDPHICYSSQLTSLRLTLERATTDAVKRICPQCNLAFVKSEGCNKLVCPCGYSMCYICRQGLANEGYHHFCQHFRERPGETCRECNKCDLYRVENEDLVIKRARERAEAEWWDQQGDGAKSGLRKEASKKAMEDCAVGVGAKVKGWCNWEKWLERGLDAVVV